MSSIKRLLTSLLLALALIVVPVQVQVANATLLFAGTEMESFIFIGTSGISTNTATFRTAYSRMSFDPNGDSSDPPSGRVYTTPFTANQTVWIHQVAYTTSGSGNQQFMCAITADGVCRLVIRAAGSFVKVSTRTSGGAFVDLISCTSGGWPINSVVSKLDWKIVYSTTGSSDLWVNGVNICSYSGDVTAASGQTQINQFYWGRPAGGFQLNVSEVIVATTDTRDMNLWTCAPGANGTTQNWTGTASSVNKVNIDDSTSISTTATGTIGNFTCGLSLPSGSWTVPGIALAARVQGLPGTIANFRFSTRPAGSGGDFDTTADIPVTGIFTSFPNNIVTANPNTSAAWLPTDFGSGFNAGIKSRP